MNANDRVVKLRIPSTLLICLMEGGRDIGYGSGGRSWANNNVCRMMNMMIDDVVKLYSTFLSPAKYFSLDISLILAIIPT